MTVEVTDNHATATKWETYQPDRNLSYRFWTLPARDCVALDKFVIENRKHTNMRLAFCADDKVLWYEGIKESTPVHRRIPNGRSFNWIRVDYETNGEWKSYLLWSEWRGQLLQVPLYALAQKEVPTSASPFILPYCIHDTFQSKIMVHSEIDEDRNLYNGSQTREALEDVGFSH
jgi:hypothetical protein